MKTVTTNSTVGRKSSSPLQRVNSPQSSPNWTSFERHRSYEAELASTPDVRSDAVARGRALIANPNYPSREQLGKIARVLLAGGLNR
jgi:hypothetical protein